MLTTAFRSAAADTARSPVRQAPLQHLLRRHARGGVHQRRDRAQLLIRARRRGKKMLPMIRVRLSLIILPDMKTTRLADKKERKSFSSEA